MKLRSCDNIFTKFTLKKGIELKRVVLDQTEKIESLLCCKNCDLLVYKPYFCSNCNVLYCQICALLNESDLCSLCKSTSLTTNIPQFIKVMLSKYRIKCRNLDENCDFVLYYENLEDHEDNCYKEKILCLFPDCKEKVDRKNYPLHIKKCPLRIVSCRYCAKDYKYCEIWNHEMSCEMRMVSCYGCNRKVLNKFLNDHIDICDNIQVICSDCQTNINKSEMMNHSQMECFEIRSNRFKQESMVKVNQLFDQIQILEFRLDQINLCDSNKCDKCEKNGCSVEIEKCLECLFCSCRHCTKEFWKKNQRDGCLSCIFCNSSDYQTDTFERNSRSVHKQFELNHTDIISEN